MTTQPANLTTKFKEAIRLTLIVGSSLSIALAGNLAKSDDTISNSADKSADATSTVLPTKPETAVAKAASNAINEKPRPASKFETFAEGQITTFQETLDALTERAEIVTEQNNISDADRARLQAALKDFDENLMEARDSLSKARASKTAPDKFAEEDLRSNLFAVQESASNAQGEMLSLDQLQGFRVSRTGQ